MPKSTEIENGKDRDSLFVLLLSRSFAGFLIIHHSYKSILSVFEIGYKEVMIFLYPDS